MNISIYISLRCICQQFPKFCISFILLVVLVKLEGVKQQYLNTKMALWRALQNKILNSPFKFTFYKKIQIVSYLHEMNSC